MDNLSDLAKYQELRKRIIRNEELSDNDWELFFELEMKHKESRHSKETWSNLLLNSKLLPDNRKAVFVKKEHSWKKMVNLLNPVMTRKHQLAYAGLIIFFLIGFLSYSGLTRKELPQTSSSVTVPMENEPRLPVPLPSEKPEIKARSHDLAAYTENEMLEGYISDVKRSASERLLLTSPQPSLRFQLKEGSDSLTLSFAGTIYASSDPEEKIVLKIFSNVPDDYSDDKPLILENLDLLAGENASSFDRKIRYPMKKGLYYYSIEDLRNEEILYLNKFYIY